MAFDMYEFLYNRQGERHEDEAVGALGGSRPGRPLAVSRRRRPAGKNNAPPSGMRPGEGALEKEKKDYSAFLALGLTISPERRHRVHTVRVVTSPEGNWARTENRLGSKRRLLLLLAWLTLLPLWGFLPHLSHILDMGSLRISYPPLRKAFLIHRARHFRAGHLARVKNFA